MTGVHQGLVSDAANCAAPHIPETARSTEKKKQSKKRKVDLQGI